MQIRDTPLASHFLSFHSTQETWASLCRGLFPSVPPWDPFLTVAPVLTLGSSHTYFAMVRYAKPLFSLLPLEEVASLSSAFCNSQEGFKLKKWVKSLNCWENSGSSLIGPEEVEVKEVTHPISSPGWWWVAHCIPITLSSRSFSQILSGSFYMLSVEGRI